MLGNNSTMMIPTDNTGGNMAEKLVNVSLTLEESQVKYLNKEAKKNDLKRSQIVRGLIRKDMETKVKA